MRGSKVYEAGVVTFADLSKECPFPSQNITVVVCDCAVGLEPSTSRHWQSRAVEFGSASLTCGRHCGQRVYSLRRVVEGATLLPRRGFGA